MKIKESNIYDRLSRIFGRIAASGTAALAFVFALNLFAPIIRTNAEEVLDTEVAATVHSVASINLSSEELYFSIVPTDDGAFASDSVVANVNTNSSAGFELYMNTTDDSADMTSRSTTSVISSNFEGIKTSETMGSNTWGFSLDNVNFSKIPLAGSDTVIKNYTTLPAVNDRAIEVHFGVKVDNTLPKNTYAKSVVFSVVAHEPYVTIFDLTYMQQMTATACHNTTLPTPWTADTVDYHTTDNSKIPTKTLIDKRDGKSYTVSKFADGQCWMTENLALELDNEKVLTPKTTDLNTKTSWKPKNDSSDNDDENWPFWSSTPMSSVEDHSYLDETYGGYYNWVAATAGHNDEADGATVEDSICPRGWRLPVRSGERSYAYLFQQYTHVSIDDFFNAPLKLKAGGYYRYNQSSNAVSGKAGWYNGEGGQAWYWTSTVVDGGDSQAYALDSALSTDAYPGLDTARTMFKAHGLNVRCVAR